MAETGDYELLRRSARGDEDAFRALYRRHHPAVFRFTLQMCGQWELAEEVGQEVFLALIQRPGGYDSDRGGLTSYLLGIARRQLARRFERDWRHEPLDAGADEPEAPEDLLDDLSRTQQTEALRAALLCLPAVYREAVALCDIEGLTYQEAALAAETAVGTIRSRLHRGRALLLRKLAPLRQAAKETTR